MTDNLFKNDTRDGQEILYILPALTLNPAASVLRNRRYEIIDRSRLNIRTGVVFKEDRTLEIANIAGIELSRPVLKTVAGLGAGNLTFRTASSNNYVWENVPNPGAVKQFIETLKNTGPRMHHASQESSFSGPNFLSRPSQRFREIAVLPAGFADLNSRNAQEMNLVESISWDGKDTSYILTNGLAANTTRLWNPKTGQLVSTLETDEPLRHARLNYNEYDNFHYITAIKGAATVTRWKSKKSMANLAGLEWQLDSKEIFPPIEGITNPYITQAIWDFWSPKAVLIENNSKETNKSPISALRSTMNGQTLMRIFNSKIKSIHVFDHKSSVGAITDEIIYIKSHHPENKEKEYLIGQVQDLGCLWGDIITAGRGLFYPEGHFPIDYLRTHDERGPVFPHKFFLKLSSHSGMHNNFVAASDQKGTITLMNTRGGWLDDKKLLSELFGHERPLTHLVTQDDFITSASEDRTIRVWDPKNGTEIGKFENCHPLLHPFAPEYGPKHGGFAYADVDGNAHVMEYNPG